MAIAGAKKFTVGTDGIARSGDSSSNFVVTLAGGTNDSNRTWLDVSGAMTGINVDGRSSWTRVDVDGDMNNSSIILGHDAKLYAGVADSGGDVIGTPISVNNRGTVTIGANDGSSYEVEVRGGVMSFGTSSAGSSDTTTVTIWGHAGTSTNPINENWNLRGYSDVTIKRDFVMVDQESPPITLPLVEQQEHSKLTVVGNTTGGDWHVLEDSEFTANVNATVITGGEWEIEDQSTVLVEEVQHGFWTVCSTGHDGNPGLKVEKLLNPDSLTVDGVTAQGFELGIDVCQEGVFPWDMTLKNGATVVVDNFAGWHAGIGDWHPFFVGECSYPLTKDSRIIYEGTGNLYHLKSNAALGIGGELDRVGTSSTLEIRMETEGACYFTVDLSRFNTGGQTETAVFESEGTTFRFITGSGALFDLVSPDYRTVPSTCRTSVTAYCSSTGNCNQGNVLFTDSIAVRRWKKFQVDDDSVGLIDSFSNSPIAESPCVLSDALYAIDITIADGANLSNGGKNVYYTGALQANTSGYGSITGSGSVIQLTPTLYGDFDGDSNGNESADTDRFNSAWCREADDGSDLYDPLVDYNSDGLINCHDRNRFLTNWPSATINGPSCSLNNCP